MTTTIENNLKSYLLENVEEAKQAIRELNAWDGSLDHLAVHENDEEFFNTYFDGDVAGAVRAISFGDFVYGDDLIRFNGYGNLETLNNYQYEEEIEAEIDEIVDLIIEKQAHLSLDSDIESILEEAEEDEEEE